MGSNRGTGIGTALCVFVAALALAAPAKGAITIGHSLQAPANGVLSCHVNCTVGQISLSTGHIASGGFASPVNGVVVRYRLRLNANFTEASVPIALRVFSYSAGQGSATGSGAPATLLVQSGVQEFPTRVPIGAGQLIGIDLPGTVDFGILTAVTGPRIADWFPPLVDGEAARTPMPIFNDAELLLQADVEADADGDGFGDETQDGCPSQGATQGPCVPPDTFIDSKEVFGKKKNKAKVAFHSNDPAATFFCKLGQRKELQCSSPTVFSKLPPGKNKIFIRASANSTVDPTPAVAKVKVKKKAKK